jgi:predicted lipid-binding transport protein (Tim44 family)
MIKATITAATLLLLVPSVASAQRAGDAALGALAGAVVLGPVGAVAGAFVGYSAGPSISRSWGLEGSRSSSRRRQASRDSVRGARAEATTSEAPKAAGPARPASPRAAAKPQFPPVQTLD